jgi:hypothetical protein
MSPPAAASVPRTRLRRFAPVGLVVIGVLMLVGLGAWLLLRPPTYPPSRMVGWQLWYGPDPAAADTTNVISLEVSRSGCAPADLSWLDPPVVTYTSSSVTIALHTTDAFGDWSHCVPAESGRVPIVGTYLSGVYLAVQLSEPLGGRALFDGVTTPPIARPYTR